MRYRNSGPAGAPVFPKKGDVVQLELIQEERLTEYLRKFWKPFCENRVTDGRIRRARGVSALAGGRWKKILASGVAALGGLNRNLRREESTPETLAC